MGTSRLRPPSGRPTQPRDPIRHPGDGEKIYETRGNFKGARRDFLLPEAVGESFDTSPDLAGGSEQIPLARQPFELIRAALVESQSRA